MKLMRGRGEERKRRQSLGSGQWERSGEGGTSSEINLANNSNSDLDISDEKLIKKHGSIKNM